MKFIDLLKEPSEEKLLKKAKAVFSALRRGKISRDNGSQVFTYELGNRTFARVKDGEVEVVGSVISIKKLTFCPLNERFMTELIEKKFFDMFDIRAELQPPTKDQVEEYTGKMPWEKEEPIELNEDDLTEKERKRVKTVHKAIRKGIVNLTYGKYRYELPEDYKFYLIDNEIINIKFTFYNHDLGPSFAGVGLPLRVWRIEDGKDVFLNGILSNADVSDIVYGDEYLINTKSGAEYTNVKNKVKNKYRDFNINAIMTSPTDNPMDLTPMVNEHAEVLNPESLTNKEIKKVKLVYNTFKKGHFAYDELSTYGYKLPDDYYIYRDELGDVCIKLDKKDTDKFYMFAKINSHEMELQPHHTGLHGWLKDRIIKKFDGFNIKFIF